MSITRTSKNGLSILSFKTPLVETSLTLHGAHLLSWKPKDQDEVLYLSETAIFDKSKAIRGGVPVCWPWFGPVRSPSHGYARISEWNEDVAEILSDGSVHVKLSLSINDPEMKAIAEFNMNDKTLHQTLKTINGPKAYDMTAALHTYYSIGDIEKIHITGLENVPFSEKSAKPLPHSENPLRIFGEVDREYYPTTAPIELHDEVKNRTIRVEREGSNCSVVWNIWERASGFNDMPDNDYRKYVCIEAANTSGDIIHLGPNEEHVLGAKTTIVK
ncbi:putative glucose-6-phosphate 1-epimerase [Tritrichomonas foetus]|uniref:glucose-6-phosphate 1-epimerase n=1 Tax=Tritrichomonas foetus TaxID=1144522 RepID=A0A1J4KVA4_9EUKA|nr:putative glucose-6-phosphate 1-epimerase [Tritrichomonas foetus]|eukprot:OHT14824.1 putative glucose-6-phosphate 1-epimerase [Tritrichomonas foetus]